MSAGAPPSSFSRYYHEWLSRSYAHLVPAGSSVLEIGCGAGDLLASLQPSRGVGLDTSESALEEGRRKHPHLEFVRADAHEFELEEKFDFIVLSDLVMDLKDVQQVLRRARVHSGEATRILINTYSRVWQLPLSAARQLGLSHSHPPENWLTVEDLSNLLHLEDFETIRSWPELLLPSKALGLGALANRVLVRALPFRPLGMSNFIVARPVQSVRAEPEAAPIVSVVVPARNEAGNIRQILERTPEMGGGTEIVFVEGNSTDDTFETIQQVAADFPERRFQIHQQKGKGKGDAVRLGFEKAQGGVFMILDADMTVPPEDLPRFYEALMSDKGDLINGVRLVYPMEDEAMRFFNLLGNKFFSYSFSWLLSQSIKDTLCGTKVMKRETYERIAANRDYFGDFDPFGDFDLLFGAARLNFKIIDLPIRYRNRTYGDTNIDRWRHGVILLKMTGVAAKRLRFM